MGQELSLPSKPDLPEKVITRTSRLKLKHSEEEDCENSETEDNENEESQASLTQTLPNEIKEKILALLRPRERQELRLVSRQFRSDVDNLVGPVDFLIISPEPVFQVKERLEFLRKCRIEGLELRGPTLCPSLGVPDLTANMERIKKLRLSSQLTLKADLLLDLLQELGRLEWLKITGRVEGLFEHEDDFLMRTRLALLPELRTVHINTRFFHLASREEQCPCSCPICMRKERPFSQSRRKLTFSAVQMWHNQIYLLENIAGSKVKEAALFLHTIEQEGSTASVEDLLLQKVANFLGRSGDMRKLVLHHGVTKMARNEQRMSHITLTPDRQWPLTLTEVEFYSHVVSQFAEEDDVAGQEGSSSFDLKILSLLKRGKGLKTLRFSGQKTKPIRWSEFTEVVSAHGETLEKLTISAELVGENDQLDLSLVTYCPNLTFLSLHNRQSRRPRPRGLERVPTIQNFAWSKAQRLETLLLQNVLFSPEEFGRLKSLKGLRNFGLYFWPCGNGGPAEEVLGTESALRILEADGLLQFLFPWPKLFTLPGGVEQVTLAKGREGGVFLHPTEEKRKVRVGLIRYIATMPRPNKEGKGTKGFWRKTEWGFKIEEGFCV